MINSTFARLSLLALTAVAVTALNAQPAGAPPAGGAPPGGPPAGGPPPTMQIERIKDLGKVSSGDYQLDPDHGRIIWSLSHHGYSKLAALLPQNEGTLHLDTNNVASSKLDVTIHVDKVLTGVPSEHFDTLLKSDRILDTAKYPTAQFKSTRVEQVGPNKLKVTGDLTFRGVTKPLVLDATFNQGGEGMGSYTVGFDATGTMKRSEYGVDFLLPSVSDEVQLTIEAEFKKPGKGAAPPR